MIRRYNLRSSLAVYRPEIIPVRQGGGGVLMQ
jgi:hypothetical protein